LNKKYILSELYPLIEEQLNNGGSASFTVNGISMSPMLSDGIDTVHITKPDFPLKKYDIPFYRRKNGQFVLHRIIKVTPEGYICRGDHQIIKEHVITDNMIIGVLSEYTHKGRQKRVDGFKYKLYVFIYVHTAYLRYYTRAIIRRFKK
jgi:hypothetical protein